MSLGSSRSRGSPAAAAVLFSVLVVISLLATARGASAAEVPPDPPLLCIDCGENTEVTPSGNTFTGTQLVPGRDGVARPIGHTGGDSSSCPGCTFRIVSVCDFGNGCRETGGGGTCADPEESQYAVMATRPPAAEQVEGFVCLGPDQSPVPVDTITARVRTLVDELIPTDAGVRVQPPGGTLVNVPTIVRADGGRQAITQEFFAAGFAVAVTARPVLWTWTFGPDESASFAYPGDGYTPGVDPTTSGRHATWTYSRAGTRQLQVVVTWEAEYVLAGVGTVSAGSVERASAPVLLQVHEARTELLAG